MATKHINSSGEDAKQTRHPLSTGIFSVNKAPSNKLKIWQNLENNATQIMIFLPYTINCVAEINNLSKLFQLAPILGVKLIRWKFGAMALDFEFGAMNSHPCEYMIACLYKVKRAIRLYV